MCFSGTTHAFKIGVCLQQYRAAIGSFKKLNRYSIKLTNHFHDKNVVAPSDFFYCLSKKADCLSLIASLCIAIYLLPILFGLLLIVKCNHMQLIRFIHMPVNTTSPSLYITSNYAVKFLLCAVSCRRNSSPLHWQMKELIVVIFHLHLALAKCLSLAHRLFYLKTSVNHFPCVKLIFKIFNNKVNIITINLRLASIDTIDSCIQSINSKSRSNKI